MNPMSEQKLAYKSPPIEALQNGAIDLLKQLIAIPSLSKQEHDTASCIEQFLHSKNITTQRLGNNVWARNQFFDASKPTILLNSHHDTVKPNAGYTNNPFEPIEENGKLYGLGSNDAGGPLVSLMAAFLYFYPVPELKYNFIYAATAEEEISGKDGVASILDSIGPIDVAIVGEPTQMELAIAEKGLLVIDCVSKGISGHAAHPNPNNAIINALDDLHWFRNFRFPKVSKFLGEVKMSVTIIHAGNQHNVVPDTCTFTVDIRTTDDYSNQKVLDIVQSHVQCEVTPRSMILNASAIAEEHPLVEAGIQLGRKVYGSPTSSDMAVMNFPAVKMGPGNSLRSHTPDEFIFIEEIESGIEIYIQMLSKIVIS